MLGGSSPNGTAMVAFSPSSSRNSAPERSSAASSVSGIGSVSEARTSSVSVWLTRSTSEETSLKSGFTVFAVCVGSAVCVVESVALMLSGRAVVINLEGVQVDLAQRIIDFSSGACYSIDGNLQKISSYIFIITPSNIELTGEFQSVSGSNASVR